MLKKQKTTCKKKTKKQKKQGREYALDSVFHQVEKEVIACGRNRVPQVVLSWGGFCLLWGHLAISGDVFDCRDLGRGTLLASCGWRPEMLLDILQYPGQTPLTKNDPAQDVSSAGAGLLVVYVSSLLNLSGHLLPSTN